MTKEKFDEITKVFFEFGLLILFMTIPQILLGIYCGDWTGNYYAIGFFIGMYFQKYKERKFKKRVRKLLEMMKPYVEEAEAAINKEHQA